MLISSIISKSNVIGALAICTLFGLSFLSDFGKSKQSTVSAQFFDDYCDFCDPYYDVDCQYYCGGITDYEEEELIPYTSDGFDDFSVTSEGRAADPSFTVTGNDDSNDSTDYGHHSPVRRRRPRRHRRKRHGRRVSRRENNYNYNYNYNDNYSSPSSYRPLYGNYDYSAPIHRSNRRNFDNRNVQTILDIEYQPQPMRVTPTPRPRPTPPNVSILTHGPFKHGGPFKNGPFLGAGPVDDD